MQNVMYFIANPGFAQFCSTLTKLGTGHQVSAQGSKRHLLCQWFTLASAVSGGGGGGLGLARCQDLSFEVITDKERGGGAQSSSGKTSQLPQDPASLRTETQVLIIIFLMTSAVSRNQYISIHATFSYLSEVTAGESLCQ